MSELSPGESLGLLFCGCTVLMLMAALPYVFGWWWRRK